MKMSAIRYITAYDEDGNVIENRPVSDFESAALSIGGLVTEKNKAYGDSFRRSGEIMRILYPQGIKPEQMADALAIIRIIDKFFRIATARGADAMGENPWEDVAGYGLLRWTAVKGQAETDRALWRAMNKYSDAFRKNNKDGHHDDGDDAAAGAGQG